MPLTPTLFIIDPEFHHDFASIEEWARKENISVYLFHSAEQFLIEAQRNQIACLFTELRLPQIDGLELLQKMQQIGWELPTVVTARSATITHCAQAFKLGAVDFWEKPVSVDRVYCKAIELLDQRRQAYQQWEKQKTIRDRVRTLTDRESKVFRALVSGQSMKEIAGEFGTSFQAIARHRQHILTKLCAENDVVLCKLAHCYLSDQFESEPAEKLGVSVI